MLTRDQLFELYNDRSYYGEAISEEAPGAFGIHKRPEGFDGKNHEGTIFHLDCGNGPGFYMLVKLDSNYCIAWGYNRNGPNRILFRLEHQHLPRPHILGKNYRTLFRQHA